MDSRQWVCQVQNKQPIHVPLTDLRLRLSLDRLQPALRRKVGSIQMLEAGKGPIRCKPLRLEAGRTCVRGKAVLLEEGRSRTRCKTAVKEAGRIRMHCKTLLLEPV